MVEMPKSKDLCYESPLTIVPHQLQKWTKEVRRSCEESVEPGRDGMDWKVIISGGLSIYFAHKWLILRPVDVGKPRDPTIWKLLNLVSDSVLSIGLGNGEAGGLPNAIGEETFQRLGSREGAKVVNEAGFQEFKVVIALSIFFLRLVCNLMVELLLLLDGGDEPLGNFHNCFRAQVKLKGSGSRF
jgi:hypothetical protein